MNRHLCKLEREREGEGCGLKYAPFPINLGVTLSLVIIIVSATLWGQVFCPLFRHCPFFGGGNQYIKAGGEQYVHCGEAVHSLECPLLEVPLYIMVALVSRTGTYD